MNIIVILLALELSKPLDEKTVKVDKPKAVSSAVSLKKTSDAEKQEMKTVIDKAAKEAAKKTDEHFKKWETDFLEETKKEVESFEIKK